MPAFSMTAPGAIEFGIDALKMLPSAVDRVQRSRTFLVTDPGIVASGILGQVLAVLDAAGIEHEVFAEVEANPSLDTVDRAAGRARSFGEAAIIAVGGGSSLDAAKAIALASCNVLSARELSEGPAGLQPGQPVIAIPTTAGTGAETNGFGVIDDPANRRKVYIGDPSVAPRVAILDPALTVGLPAAVTAATGVDALVHAVESLVSISRHAISEAYAHQAARLVFPALPAAVQDGRNMQARSDMLLGSHLAGLALSQSGLGLVHGIGHAVTAHVGAAHGMALSAVFAQVLEFNLPVSATQYASLAFDLGVGDTTADEVANARATVESCRQVLGQVRTANTLSGLGCTEEMIPSLVRTTLADAVTRNTPRQPTSDELTQLLGRCL